MSHADIQREIGLVVISKNNGIILEPKVVTLCENLSYILEPLANGYLMNLCLNVGRSGGNCYCES